MGISGGGPTGFPNNVNLGDLHVQKSADATTLLIWMYIHGDPSLPSSWFLLGGRYPGDPDFGQWGTNNIGSQWFNSQTNVSKQFGASGTISQSISSSTVKGMYRDARDLIGTLVDSGCSFASWTTWTYHIDQICGNATQAQADAIAGNGFTGAAGSTGLFSSLVAGTYVAWVLAKGQSARQVRLVHNGTTLNVTPGFATSAPEPASYTWVSMGSIVVDPTLTVSLSFPAAGLNTNVTMWVRGIYFTNQGDTPVFSPTGKSGNLVF